MIRALTFAGLFTEPQSFYTGKPCWTTDEIHTMIAQIYYLLIIVEKPPLFVLSPLLVNVVLPIFRCIAVVERWP